MELTRERQNGREAVAFIFTDDELRSLAKAARRRITDVKRILHRWENHPLDEGQVTYSEKRKECRNEIAFLEDFINYSIIVK